MSIVVAWLSDRADQYIHQAQASFRQSIDTVLLGKTFDDRDHHLGLAGNVRAAWQWAIDMDCDYLFHVEEDFLFTAPVDLAALQLVLESEPRLAQVVLKRQPWSPPEIAAGGIIEQDPGAYIEVHKWGRSLKWVEHRKIFSLNPCLIPRKILELGWPAGNEAEMTRRCLDAGYRFAFYGGKTDPPKVEHIGAQRSHGWRL